MNQVSVVIVPCLSFFLFDFGLVFVLWAPLSFRTVGVEKLDWGEGERNKIKKGVKEREGERERLRNLVVKQTVRVGVVLDKRRLLPNQASRLPFTRSSAIIFCRLGEWATGLKHARLFLLLLPGLEVVRVWFTIPHAVLPCFSPFFSVSSVYCFDVTLSLRSFPPPPLPSPANLLCWRRAFCGFLFYRCLRAPISLPSFLSFLFFFLRSLPHNESPKCGIFIIRDCPLHPSSPTLRFWFVAIGNTTFPSSFQYITWEK